MNSWTCKKHKDTSGNRFVGFPICKICMAEQEIEGLKMMLESHKQTITQIKIMVPPKCESCSEPCGHDWCPVKDEK